MTSINAVTAVNTQSALRPADQPLAWVGADRILLDDTSRYGLRRKVIARKEGVPDVEGFVQAAQKQAVDAEVSWWVSEKGEYVYLWIVWKPKRGR